MSAVTVLRRAAGRVVRTFLSDRGYLLVPKHIFGVEVWSDVTRLAREWGYPLETFFDVGANDGYTATVALQNFPAARVVCFEPHPETFAALKAAFQNEPRVLPVNCALSTQTGSLDMYEFDGNSHINSFLENAPYAVRFKQTGRPVKVQVDTLDTYCSRNSIGRIDILKIDTEGHDSNVLEGGKALLAQGAVRFVYVEFNDLQTRPGTSGGSLIEIDKVLRDYDYRFVATYTDYIITKGEMFSVSNALFALPPRSA